MTIGGTRTSLGINRRGWQVQQYIHPKSPQELKEIFGKLGLRAIHRGTKRRLIKLGVQNVLRENQETIREMMQ